MLTDGEGRTWIYVGEGDVCDLYPNVVESDIRLEMRLADETHGSDNFFGLSSGLNAGVYSRPWLRYHLI